MTAIDFIFPIPVQGALAGKMQELISRFNAAHPAITVTSQHCASYDDANAKVQAMVRAGKPPALALLSANSVRDLVIHGHIIAFDDLIAASGDDPATYFERFWPALESNAVIEGQVRAIPFHNSTPLLFYNAEAFAEVGLDPDQPPQDWQAWLDTARKLTKPGGSRWGLMFPGTYDYCGWIVSSLAMSNGGQLYNHDYGGEVYYNKPSTVGALAFLDTLVRRAKAMPPGVAEAETCTEAFFSGRAGMIVASTGALGFIRQHMTRPYRAAFLPKSLRYAATVGGASLVIPANNGNAREQAAWTLARWLASPAINGEWSRFTGYFAPNKDAYDLQEMQAFLRAHPDAQVALYQLAHAMPWFDTYNVVAVRKAFEHQIQALLNGKTTPAKAAAAAQSEADALLQPYVNRTALRKLR
jgi:sn-glycerol 3-phosphate transport system substrate-binding protein